MNDDIRKLLGGYATGTLTEAERASLFSAALDDQQLFEALADEQALKELLEDSAARSTLLQATETPRFTVGGALREWFERPRSKALTALGILALTAIGVRAVWEHRPVQPTKQVATAVTPDPHPPVQRQPAPVSVPPPLVAKRSAVRKSDAAPPPPPSATLVSADEAPALETAKVENSSGTATKLARAGALELQYTVLLRQPDGTFKPVPSEHVFAPGDRVQLSVQPSERGLLVLKTGTNVRFGGPVEPGAAAVVGGEMNVDETDAIEVAFTPLPLVPATAPTALSFRDTQANATAQPAELRRKAAAQSAAVAPAAPPAAPARPTAGLQLRILLRKK
jgi:hypothetical protein